MTDKAQIFRGFFAPSLVGLHPVRPADRPTPPPPPQAPEQRTIPSSSRPAPTAQIFRGFFAPSLVGLLRADWDESQHPRDDSGRFGEGGGGGGGAFGEDDTSFNFGANVGKAFEEKKPEAEKPAKEKKEKKPKKEKAKHEKGATNPERSYKGRSTVMWSLKDGMAEFLAAPSAKAGYTNEEVIIEHLGTAGTKAKDTPTFDGVSGKYDEKCKTFEDAFRVVARPYGSKGHRDWHDFDIQALRETHPAFEALQYPPWVEEMLQHEEFAKHAYGKEAA